MRNEESTTFIFPPHFPAFSFHFHSSYTRKREFSEREREKREEIFLNAIVFVVYNIKFSYQS
jgi:hypothetical protein